MLVKDHSDRSPHDLRTFLGNNDSEHVFVFFPSSAAAAILRCYLFDVRFGGEASRIRSTSSYTDTGRRFGLILLASLREICSLQSAATDLSNGVDRTYLSVSKIIFQCHVKDITAMRFTNKLFILKSNVNLNKKFGPNVQGHEQKQLLPSLTLT